MTGHRQRGFSLLELLVTLFIIVLITSLVTLNVGSGGGDIALRGKVEDLADTASYALDEAQFTGRDFGLLLSLEDDRGEWIYRYRWLERGQAFWVAPTSGKDVFAGGQFPQDLDMQLQLDGVFQDEELFSNISEQPTPQILFYASGETTPGVLELLSRETGEVLWRIEWGLLGDFRTLRGGQAEEEY